jgi:hypothetical protein
MLLARPRLFRRPVLDLVLAGQPAREATVGGRGQPQPFLSMTLIC